MGRDLVGSWCCVNPWHCPIAKKSNIELQTEIVFHIIFIKIDRKLDQSLCVVNWLAIEERISRRCCVCWKNRISILYARA